MEQVIKAGTVYRDLCIMTSVIEQLCSPIFSFITKITGIPNVLN